MQTTYSDLIIQAVREKGRIRTVFSGRSMLPALRDGMHIAVERTCLEDVRPADIILYRRDSSLIVHRVVKIFHKDKRKFFVTRGDNQFYPDASAASEGDLVGVVRAAFCEKDLKRDILVKSRTIGAFYVIIGNVMLYFFNKRRRIPKLVRIILRTFARLFFFAFKCSVHCIYRLYYGQMSFARG